MVSRPWMPLYVADYLADTSHLRAAEHGAYLLLIMHYWQNGGLPAEEKKLARIARMSDREWKAARDTLAEFFTGDWRHERIDRELSEATEKYERRAKAGRDGGNARAQRLASGKHPGSNATSIANEKSSNATQSPQALLNQPQPQSEIAASAAIRERPPPDDPPPGASPSVPNEFDQLQRACCAALGDAAPADVVIGPMMEIVRKFGKTAVLDALQSEGRRPRRKPIKTWSLWATIVREALASSPPAAADEPAAERGVDIGYAGIIWSESTARRILERWSEDRSTWRDAWGPPPDRSKRLRDLAKQLEIQLPRAEASAAG